MALKDKITTYNLTVVINNNQVRKYKELSRVAVRTYMKYYNENHKAHFWVYNSETGFLEEKI